MTVVLILCLVSTMALAGNVRYKDIASDHWAYQSIYKMSAQDVIAGYEDTTVRADNNITQFEAICFAVRVMGLDKDTANVAKGEYLPFNIPDWDGAYETAVVAYKANLIDADDFSRSDCGGNMWAEPQRLSKDSELPDSGDKCSAVYASIRYQTL